MTLSGNNSGIDDVGGIQTLTIGDQTIQGVGNIGRNSIEVINNGTILANDATAPLTIDVAGTDFENDGTLQVANGATLEVIADLIGSSTATLAGDGTITATGGDIQHLGLIAPGDDSAGSLVLDANVALGPAAEIRIEIGGASEGQFDVLTVNDNLTLDGLLTLVIIDEFVPDEDDTFEIILSPSPLGGSFANIVAGDTLLTADGSGQFTVNFGPGNSVVLSDFSVNTVAHGDVNLDGVLDFLDISPFIVILATGGFQEEADCDGNGVVDFLDISPFVVALSLSGS